MQNGKDVYVEKPVSHNVSEGRRIVEAARKYNKICQAGTQSRSSTGMREAMEFLHAGKLGKVKLARGLCYKPRGSIGKVDGPQQPPEDDRLRPLVRPGPEEARCMPQAAVHYDWHWIWDYGNGDLGNQGIHEMDKARWGLGKNELAKSRPQRRRPLRLRRRRPDGQHADLRLRLRRLRADLRGARPQDRPACMGAKVGNIFYGSEGYLVCPELRQRHRLHAKTAR